MKKKKCLRLVAVFAVLASIGVFIAARIQEGFKIAAVRTSPDLSPPVRLEADGEPINIGKLSSAAHAGPWIADVDGDGDQDLLVGGFPGYFWLFENRGTEENPVYIGKGNLQAGGEDAETPIY